MSDRTRARRPYPRGYWVIWTTVAIDLIGFGIVAPILPIYAARFGATGFTAGLLFSSFSLAQFVCSPILGRLSDRIGRKPVIVLSLFGTAAGSFLTGAAPGLWLLFVGRVVDGASGASVSVAQGAVTDLASPEDRPRLLGMIGAAFGVGFVLGPAIGGLAAHFGPRVPFYVAGTIALVNGVVAIVRLPETRSVGTVRPTGGTALRSPALIRLAVVGFLSTAAFSGFEATFALFGQRRFGLTEGSVAAVFVGIGVVLVVVQGRLVGTVAARLGVFAAYRSALAATAIGLAVLAAAMSWWVLAVALVLLAVGQGIASPMITTLVAEHAVDHRRGEALGYQQSANAVARIAGPAAAGAMFRWVGIATPYVVGAFLTAGAIVAVSSRIRAPRTAMAGPVE